MQTHFGIKFMLGMPRPNITGSLRGNAFRFTWKPQEDEDEPIADLKEGDSDSRHSIYKVMESEQRLQTENNLIQAQITREEAFAKAYVTLLKLSEEARRYLTLLRASGDLQSFYLTGTVRTGR